LSGFSGLKSEEFEGERAMQLRWTGPAFPGAGSSKI